MKFIIRIIDQCAQMPRQTRLFHYIGSARKAGKAGRIPGSSVMNLTLSMDVPQDNELVVYTFSFLSPSFWVLFSRSVHTRSRQVGRVTGRSLGKRVYKYPLALRYKDCNKKDLAKTQQGEVESHVRMKLNFPSQGRTLYRQTQDLQHPEVFKRRHCKFSPASHSALHHHHHVFLLEPQF